MLPICIPFLLLQPHNVAAASTATAISTVAAYVYSPTSVVAATATYNIPVNCLSTASVAFSALATAFAVFIVSSASTVSASADIVYLHCVPLLLQLFLYYCCCWHCFMMLLIHDWPVLLSAFSSRYQYPSTRAFQHRSAILFCCLNASLVMSVMHDIWPGCRHEGR